MKQGENGDQKPKKRRTSNKVLLRRKKIVELILANPLEVTCQGITDSLAVAGIKSNVSTVSEDLKDPEITEALTANLRAYGNTTLNANALKNVSRKIITENDADYSKWWLDKNGFFPSDLERLRESPVFQAYQEALAAHMAQTANAKVVGRFAKGNGQEVEIIDPTDMVILELDMPASEN